MDEKSAFRTSGIKLARIVPAAHVWHIWPLLRIGFTGGSIKGRLTGVQQLLFP